jgi:purine-binding chemotaxis protein CheW
LASIESIAESVPEPHAQTLLFRVGETVYGCDIHFVREVVRHPPTTRIPGSPAFVRGLLNVRGHVLTVLDVGARLDPQRAPVQGGSIIIVQVEERRAGLLVDEVLHVGVVPRESARDRSQSHPSELVQKLGQLDGRIVLLLDVAKLVNQALV